MQILYFLLRHAGQMSILTQKHLLRNDMKEQSSQKYTGINILFKQNHLLQNQSIKLPKSGLQLFWIKHTLILSTLNKFEENSWFNIEIRIFVTGDLHYFHCFLAFSKKRTRKPYLKFIHINATFMMIICAKFQKK